MISKHISSKEGVYSRTAQRLDIDNTPTKDHKKNMVKLAENIFEPLRAYVGGPIKINSFYRSPKLNSLEIIKILTGYMLATYHHKKIEIDA